MTKPRAAGVRMPYPEVPPRVRAWVDGALGSPVRSWEEQVGGMSPGCATRVVTADGRRAFVKAVGSVLNPDSPALFRREAEVLQLLGEHPLWASLLAAYDEDGWVALVLEDVPGGHPDLADDRQMADLLAATDRLAATLRAVPVPAGPRAATLAGPGLVDAHERFRRWASSLEHLDEIPADLVPIEVRRDPARLIGLVGLLQGDDIQVTHCDIRVDNLLRPAPARIVFVDWGAAAAGPAWIDPLLARFERVEDPWFDASVALSPVLAAAGDDVVTAFLVAFGVSLAWESTRRRADVGLPTLNEFRRTEARRALTGAARRLG